MANRFRWSKDLGATWNYVENAVLPYNIAGVGYSDQVIVDPIGDDFTMPASVVNAYSRVRAKLIAGTSTTMLVIGDSTAFVADYGPYALFAKQLGDLYDATVFVHQWGEWLSTDTSFGNGPRAYNAPVTLRSGAGPQFDLYLACLPNSAACAMWDMSRRPLALSAIPTPDVVVLHHGHNMQNYNLQSLGILGSGLGVYYSGIGMITSKWAGVPVALCTQNPWKNSDGMSVVYALYPKLASQLAGLTIVDSYALFVAAGKPDSLYRSNDAAKIHPSDSATNYAGAQLVANAHMSTFQLAKPDLTATTEDWTGTFATNVLSNGKMTDWTAALPTGFTNLSSATIVKDTVNKYDGEAWSMSLSPNIPTGTQNSGVQYSVTTAQRNAILNKRVSLAIKVVLAKSTQRIPAASFALRDSGGSTRTYTLYDYMDPKVYVNGVKNAGFDGDYWFVAADLDAGPGIDANTVIIVRPSFGVSAPANNDPVSVADFMLVVGSKPAGRLAS